MCLTLNDKRHLSYSRTRHSRKYQLPNWFLSFRYCPFSAFSRAEKQLFHIAPFHSTSYVLNIFGCLEVSNRVWNWNKGKPIIFVGSLLQIYQLLIWVFIFKFNFHNSVSIAVSYFGSCEFPVSVFFLTESCLSHDNGSILKLKDNSKVSSFFVVCGSWNPLSAKLAATINWLCGKWGLC
jgi:hypothetical protein